MQERVSQITHAFSRLSVSGIYYPTRNTPSYSFYGRAISIQTTFTLDRVFHSQCKYFIIETAPAEFDNGLNELRGDMP